MEREPGVGDFFGGSFPGLRCQRVHSTTRLSETRGGLRRVQRVDEHAARQRGLPLEVFNPWTWGMGSLDGIWIDPATGRRTARGDARRCAMAAAV